ncbi:hypothetical protein [Bradyrhizobium sp. RDM4]|uniref:hypothetical protein n=1 Tax=Bradyrhizobium sp. RDM4 TaxID=3378765 RepID=UPI0038FD0B18
MNALVPQLKARGVGAFVVLINEGGEPTCDYNKWPGISGPIVDIFEKFHRAVDIVVSGHTHRAYVCQIDGRLVTRGDKYRALVTATDVTLDSAARDIVSVKAENVIVANASLAMNTEQTALIEPYDKLVSPIANRPAGSVTQKLSCVPNDAGESALGDVIAVAQLARRRTRRTAARSSPSPIPAVSAPTSRRRRTARCPLAKCSRARSQAPSRRKVVITTKEQRASIGSPSRGSSFLRLDFKCMLPSLSATDKSNRTLKQIILRTPRRRRESSIIQSAATLSI